MKLIPNVDDINTQSCNVCGEPVSDIACSCMNCGNMFASNVPPKLIKRVGKERIVFYTNNFKLVFPYAPGKQVFELGEGSTKKWIINNVQEEWVIFDCGANIGVFTILFSMLTPNGKVFAFEPTETFEMLEKNIIHFVENKKITNAPVLERKALGKETGSFKEKLWVNWFDKKQVDEFFDFFALDDYVNEKNITRIDLLKIDVDGFDIEVLLGAENLLDTFSPTVLIEYSSKGLELRGYLVEDIDKFMKKKGYKEIEYFVGEGNKIFSKN